MGLALILGGLLVYRFGALEITILKVTWGTARRGSSPQSLDSLPRNTGQAPTCVHSLIAHSAIRQMDAQIDGESSTSFAKSFTQSFSQSFLDGGKLTRSRSGSAMSAQRSFHHSFHGTCAVEAVQPLHDVDQQIDRTSSSPTNLLSPAHSQVRGSH